MALFNGKVCRRTYYKNAKDSLGLLNVIPIKQIGETESFEITFPRPFQLIALADVSFLPPIGGYTNSWVTLANLLDQNAYSAMLQNMFISFMLANRDYDPDVVAGATLFVPGSPDWRNYFMSYLNEGTTEQQGLFELNYNSFILPGSQAINFWIEEAGLGSVSPWERLQRFAKFQFNHSDRALWGAPGKYIMNTEMVPPPLVWEPLTVEGSEDSNTFTDINIFLEDSPFIPSENIPPFPLDNTNMDSFLWVTNFISGTTVYGSEVIPTTLKPDFSGGINPAVAIANWVTSVLSQAIPDGVGYAPTAGNVFTQPLGDFSPGYGIGTNLVEEAQQYTFRIVIGADSPGFGANGNNFLHVRFEVPGASAPYRESLLEFVAEFGRPPIIVVNEYKPVE